MTPPKSPPLAFEPSPAMFLSDATTMENNSPRSFPRTNAVASDPIISPTHQSSREVRFSPPIASPTVRAQSSGFNLPMLEQISSASELPKSNRAISLSAPGDFTAYIEQSRAVLEAQRAAFDRERAGWVEERKLWDTERSILLTRIGDLEFTINKSGLRKLSTDSNNLTTPPFSAEHGAAASASNGQHDSKITSSSAAGHQVWEGSAAGTIATRVFSNEENKKAEERLPSIAEDDSPGRELSPKTVPSDRVGSMVGIPIEKLDSKLDGITLKASALSPAFVAKVMTPESLSPTISPHLRSIALGSLHLEDDHNLAHEETVNLTKHAGHTPKGENIIVEQIMNAQSPGDVQTPTQEQPFAPLPSVVRTQSENPEPAFPPPDDDPELTGPLGLGSNENEGDTQFLHALDEKLEEEARKVVHNRPPSDASEDHNAGEQQNGNDNEGGNEDGNDDDDDEEGPKLKLKHTTNFGSEFGAKECGNV